ncbi:hypothetical protein NITGR_300006 [Nitrospina gracilis 3/211]|uniref:Uncharacterized protein n=1 Tax=Nitrospina gracilis (strain 3/211) TaxID=1266370 RepID=M1YJ30_NITG3|nr:MULTISPECIES: hypothetical protein [Nitrospina]MCF8723444.1 hypothetical protein [Nitrospina sp. Nb-3]CCQ90510.1 hypothetical protein NITGR_300006 [Nitrospina gracilis 3/211]
MGGKDRHPNQGTGRKTGKFAFPANPLTIEIMKIINQYSRRLPFNIEKLTRKLLKAVPNEHLVGLDSITLMDEFQQNKYKNALGLYRKKHGLQPARIEIALGNIYGTSPFILCLIPLAGKLLYAKVLFHEIGHHYQYFTHSVSKKEAEGFAENYGKRHTVKAIKGWLYVLRPLRPAIRWINSKLDD